MEWHPAYKYIIMAVGIAIIKSLKESFQQTTEKKYKLDDDNVNDSSMLPNVNNDQGPPVSPELETSVSETIVKLIKEKNYILQSKKLSENLDYEINFVNHKKESKWDFKWESTFIKLNGNDKSKEVTYTTWSNQYEFGQNKRNNRITREFLDELKGRLI